MCFQAWFPPTAARDTKRLTSYFDWADHKKGGFGWGAAFVRPEGGIEDRNVCRFWTSNPHKAAKYVAGRPEDAWGIYHSRFPTTGAGAYLLGDNVPNIKELHPHVWTSENKKRLVLLTHNGTWREWETAGLAFGIDFESDSAAVACVLAVRGWKAASKIDETICAAIFEDGRWVLKAWKNGFPLVLLENGGVATCGSTGEFKEVGCLAKGDHDLAKPRVDTTPVVRVLSGPSFDYRRDWSEMWNFHGRR